MKEKGPCVLVGKLVGSAYRKMAEQTRKIRYFLGRAAGTVAEEVRVMTAKFGNLFKRVKTDGQLAHWEMKQKDDFAELGEEIFRLKEAELDSLFKEESILKILEQLKQDQAKLKEVKDAVYGQRRRMEEIIIFRHALDKLKNPEARVRRVALRVLERLGKKEAIPHLVNLLEDPDPEVRQRARDIIQVLTASAERPAPAK